MYKIEEETVRVPFRKWFTFQSAAGYTGLFNIVPNNLGDAISQMRTSWEHYRLNRLKATIQCGTQAVNVYNAGYVPGPDNMMGLGFCAVDYTKFTSTPSWSTATQFPLFRMGPAVHGVTLTVKQAELRKTTVPWLETTSTSSESEAFQSAGVLWHGNYASTATTAGFLCHVLLEGEIEFRDRAGYSVTALLKEEEKKEPEAYIVTNEPDYDDLDSVSVRSQGTRGATPLPRTGAPSLAGRAPARQSGTGGGGPR